MSSLENKTIAETYKDLLQISNNNSGADAVARPVEDGEGTQTALSLSTLNVGIGTTSPEAKLHIPQGSSTIAGFDLTKSCILVGSATDGIGFDNNEIVKRQETNGGSLNIASQGIDADIKFKTGARESDNVPYFRMIIDSSGNVGIGTVTPDEKLHVSGTIKATRAKLADLDIRSYPGEESEITDLLPGAFTSHFGTIIETDPNGQMIFGIRGNDENDAFRILTKNYYNSTDDEASRPYNYNAFCVESNGNVGIGTAAPGSTLHVQAHPRVSAGNGTVAHFVGDGPVAHLGLFENPDGQSLVQIKAKSDSYSILEMADAEDGNVGAIQYEHSNNNMRFKTNDSEKMRIESDGALLLHPSNVARGLKITTTQSVAVGDTTTYDTIGEGYGSHLFKTDGISRLFINKDGNVGIGTTDPDENLTIFAAVKPVIRLVGNGNNVANTNFGEIQFFNNDDSGDGPNVAAAIYARSTSSTGSGGSLVFSTENSVADGEGRSADARMVLDQVGNVGIGTTTPSSPLEVSSTTGGVVLPRLTTTEMNSISNPTDGEMIYNTTERKFYGHADGSWTPLH